MNLKSKLLACAAAMAAHMALAQSPAVSKNEIVLGGILDLSGPVASVGKPVRQGMQMRVDELNEQGGIHGRKIRLLAEDSSYDPKKAVLAAEKLASRDKVFAILGQIGSAANLATMPILFEKNIINFYPLSSARELYDPPNRLKVAFMPAYYDQMRVAAPRLMVDRNLKKPCVIYQDDEFGLEVLRGAQAGLKLVKAELAEKVSFKRGATDFSSQVAKMKAVGCDLVLMGTAVRETVGTITEARRAGFNPVFVGTYGAYSDTIARLGGKALDGLYATMTAQIPYADDATQQVRFWANKYKTQYGEDANDYSAYGYHVVDSFIRVAQRAGPDLTTDSFLKALDNMVIPRDIFGIMEASFSPTKRLGNPYSRLSQLQDSRWKIVSDYVAFNGLKIATGKDGRMKVISEQFKDE